MSNAPQPRDSKHWNKHGIMFEADQPWEWPNLQCFTSHIESLGDGRFRFWYGTRRIEDGRMSSKLAVAEGTPGGEWTRTPVVHGENPTGSEMTLSNVPADWSVTQPVHMRLKDGRYRVYFWANVHHTVLRYLVADSDDGKHYRVLGHNRPVVIHAGDRAVEWPINYNGLVRPARQSRREPDDPTIQHELIVNDATNVYQLPDGTFELYSACTFTVPEGDPRYIAHDNAKGHVRVIDRLTSDDGLHFGNRQRVIVPDDDDPVDMQFYYLAVTYTDRGREGMLGRYPCGEQTMDIEYCFSDDGVKWTRNWRKGWLPRSQPGEAQDSYMVAAPGNLVQHDGKWWLFYNGNNVAHNRQDSHGEPRPTRVMLATIDRLFE